MSCSQHLYHIDMTPHSRRSIVRPREIRLRWGRDPAPEISESRMRSTGSADVTECLALMNGDI